jgi:hypothetical protein
LKDKKLWEGAVESAHNIVEYYADLLSSGDKKRNDEILKEKILPLIASIESSIDQSRFLQLVSQKTGIPETALRQELSKVSPLTLDTQKEVQKLASSATTKGIVRRVVALLWYMEGKQSEFAKQFDDRLREILPDFNQITLLLEAEREPLLFEAQMYYANSPNIETIAKETMFFLEEEILKEKFGDAMMNLKRAEAQNDIEAIATQTRVCHDVSNQLTGLRKKYF